MFNSATLVGRVGKKDKKALKKGGEVTLLSIVTNKKYKDNAGEYQEISTWHNVNCFSTIAELAEKYVQVGDLVLIQGEIQNRKIENGEKAGQFIYSIHASNIKIIPTNTNKKQNSQAPEKSASKKSHYQQLEYDDAPF